VESDKSSKPVLVCLVVAMIVAATPFALSSAGRLVGGKVLPFTAGPDPVPPSIPFLNLSILLANRLHASLLNQSSGAYFFSVSSNWKVVTSTQYSTLGNAFIVAGLLQLYRATGNRTYCSGPRPQVINSGTMPGLR
jgi:hypothetical protein